MVCCPVLRKQVGKDQKMSVDTIGDFLTIIRNGVMACKPYVYAPYSNLKHEIALLLKQEGFVRDVSVEGDTVSSKRIKIVLKYVPGESVIHDIVRISKPCRRVYEGCANLKNVIGGLGISIMTTNRGVMTNKQARELSLGGEVICTVW